MKKLLFITALVATLSSCSVGLYTDGYHTQLSSAINLSVQPSWGPAGYDYAPYYYFPEFDFYYDVNKAIFYYLNSGRWIAAKHLPPHFPHDLHKYYKVVLTERNPWIHNRIHRQKYHKFKGVYTQPFIGHNPNKPKPNGPQYNPRRDHNNNGNHYYGEQNKPKSQTPAPNNGNWGNRTNNSRNNNTAQSPSNINGNNRYNQGQSPYRGNGTGTKAPQTNYGQQQNNRKAGVGSSQGSRNQSTSRSQQATKQSSSSKSNDKGTSSRGSSSSQSGRASGSRGR